MKNKFDLQYKQGRKKIDATAISMRKQDIEGKKYKKTFYTVVHADGTEKEIPASSIVKIK